MADGATAGELQGMSDEELVRLALPALAREARGNLLTHAGLMVRGYKVGRHHRILAEALERVERGECKRLMVCMPPRHGKSMLVSQIFPGWYLGRQPGRHVVQSGYSHEMSLFHARKAREIYESSAFGHVFPESREVAEGRVQRHASQEWGTPEGGSYYAVGVGGGLTGRGASLAIIDDPVKNREEANSRLVRLRIWGWYTSTLYTRLTPDGAVVLVMTRWHRDDLAGRLLKEMEEEGDQFEVINLPALDEDGAALWPERYSESLLGEIRRAIGPSEFSALYQQKPIAVEEMTFPLAEEWVKYEAPEGGNAMDLLRCVPGWASAIVVGFLDPAMGKGKGDFAVIVTCALGSDGKAYVIDCWMSQRTAPVDTVKRAYGLHGLLCGPSERGGRGYHGFGVEANAAQELYLPIFEQVGEEMRRANAERAWAWQLPVRGVTVQGAKELRILALEPDILNGWLVVPSDARKRWPELFDEFEGFGPESKPTHDDGPDALASCVQMLRGAKISVGDLRSERREASRIAREY